MPAAVDQLFSGAVKKQKLPRRSKGEELASDQSTIGLYLQSLQHHPQLKHAEMMELFKSYNAGITRNEAGEVTDRSPGAMRIRNKLVERNLRLVVSIAKQYKGHNMELIDLIQEGNLGLMKAIDRFKHEKGYRFSTYATCWIRQAIGQHVQKRKRTVRLPAHAAAIQRKMMQASVEYKAATGCEPSVEELTALVGASKTVVEATMHSGRGTVSLQQPISSGEADTLEDKLEDHGGGSDPFMNVSDKELLTIMEGVVRSLTPKEAAILRLRFGLNESPTNSGEYPITESELATVRQGRGLD